MISLIIVLLVAGAALYVLSMPSIPLDPTIKTIIKVVIVIAVVVWLLRAYGGALGI